MYVWLTTQNFPTFNIFLAEVVDSLTERIAFRQFLRNCMYWFMYILQQPGFVFLLKIFNVAIVVWLIIKFDMEENTIGHSDNEKQSAVFKEER